MKHSVFPEPVPDVTITDLAGVSDNVRQARS
jgi:hypothetical protein